MSDLKKPCRGVGCTAWTTLACGRCMRSLCKLHGAINLATMLHSDGSACVPVPVSGDERMSSMTHHEDTSGLVAFLTARLDEDEEAALTARRIIGDGPWWRAQTFVAVGEVLLSERAVHPHVARHDPARVLDEVEAKRAILALHAPMTPSGNRSRADQCQVCSIADESCGCVSAADGWPCATIKLVASVYRSHPDWREDWAA